MDPALRELLRSGADHEPEEVEAIIRLDQPRVDVAGVRIVARFGHVATCRLRRDLILATWHHNNVVSLKYPRPLGPEPTWDEPTGERPIDVVGTDQRRPPLVPLTGAGVVVGVVDWGCDFDHPNFKHADGSTRLLGLWDQRTPANDRSPQPYGYGTVHDRRRINDALRTGAPYDALGYHPAPAEHGTHVMDIAAGNGLAGGPVGVAPGADLVFVHLAERGARGLANLGDSARILEAVHFIATLAGRRPWVINSSIGRCAGPHDGSTLAEQALDHLVSAAPGRFIVQSGGNYFDRRTHATGRLEPGAARTLTFGTDPADLTPNELEVWYPGGDELAVCIESPTGARSPWVPLGQESDVLDGGAVVGRLYHRCHDPNNGDNLINLFLSPAAPAGAWNVNLSARRIHNGVFHAWLERDEVCRPCQARFVPDDVDRRATTGTIANGRQPFTVGAYDAHSPARPIAPFSSAGPTRDGRPKPDCVAPGVQVLAARSAPAGSVRSPGLLTRKSGTSMAAPHVTGAVALCLEGAPRLAADQIRARLQQSLDPAGSDDGRFGGGYLDIGRLVAAISSLAPKKELSMQPDLRATPPAIVRPAALYRHIAHGRDQPLPASIDRSYLVVARPGEPPRMAPARGDILVRVALGERGPGHVAVLTGDGLIPWPALSTAGLGGEREGPGQYAAVIEDGPLPHGEGDRFARRILDRYGCMPAGQLLLRVRPAVSTRLDAAVESSEDIFNRQCGFFPPAGGVVTEADLRAAVRDTATAERLRWLDPAGTILQEGDAGQFGELVRYWIGSVSDIHPSTLTHAQVVATNGTVNYQPLLAATVTATINAAAATIRAQLLAGAPGAGAPANLAALVEAALKSARRSRTGPAAARVAWSSAFVSDCARRAAISLNLETDATGPHQGQDVLLRVSGGHRVYLHEAHRRTSGPGQRDGTYHAFPPGGREVQVGDIIIQDRQANNVGAVWQFANIPNILGGRQLHGDVVVEVAADHVVAIGGNVGDSVRRRRYPLDANGRLVVVREQLYTQENNNAVLPAVPVVNPAPGLHTRSTARIFALLSPVASCFIVPSPLFGGPETAGDSLDLGADAESGSSFCAQARAQARGTDPASTRLVSLLQQPIASHDFAGIERRVREMTDLFTSLDPTQKAALRSRLTDRNDALARIFDCELHRETRRRLRALLEVPAATKPTAPPTPSPAPSGCRRREQGAITLLLPWERALLALMNDVSESTFEGMTLITGPVLLPTIHGQLHRMLVPTVLAQPDIRAITIGTEVWFREPLDTTDTNPSTSSARGLALLVHESVHVVDYERMGIDAFLGTYVASGMAAGLNHADIPHEQRANAVEAALPRLLQQFPDLNRLITSCDNDGILADLRARSEVYRAAVKSLL